MISTISLFLFFFLNELLFQEVFLSLSSNTFWAISNVLFCKPIYILYLSKYYRGQLSNKDQDFFLYFLISHCLSSINLLYNYL